MEIKFRGLAIDENKWIYGYGICVVPNTNIASIIHKQGINLMHLTAVTPETVGQFTGLTDKNGKEIYSGDIVKCLSATEPEDKGFICLFKDYRWKFNNVHYPDDDYYGTVNYNYIQGNCEIIGNIFENSELLNK